MVVDPGEKVEWNWAFAYVDPLGIVIAESTVPTFVKDEDRLIMVSCSARAGMFFESCSCTTMMS